MFSIKSSSTTMFYLICLIAAIPTIASDIFVPSIPAITVFFNTNHDYIQLAISALLGGLTISQLFYGLLSSAFGRKIPLLFGMVCILCGTALCASSKTLTMLTWGFILEGIGLGACSLYRAMLRDCYDGMEFRQKSNVAIIMITMIYPAAPMLGGYLQVFLGWQASFIFLTILSACCMVLLLFSEETNPHRSISQLSPTYIIKTYGLLLTHPPFIGYCLCMMMATTGYFAWIMTIPIYIIKNLHHSPDVLGTGMLVVCLLSIPIGGAISNRITHSTPISNVLCSAWVMLTLSSFVPCLLFVHYGFHIYWIFCAMWLYFFFTSFLWANLYAGAFSYFKQLAGEAGALFSTSYSMGCFLATIATGYASEQNPYIFCIMLATVNVLSLIFHRLFIHPSEQVVQ